MQRLRIESSHHNLTLDYNELKRLLLRTLADHGPMNSNALSQNLLILTQPNLDIHAVRMALVRYYRQGLLKRIRTAGQFTYSLTERGVRRLQWLEEQVKNPTPA
jgi:DNA-binding transcriptional regulator PaaX